MILPKSEAIIEYILNFIIHRWQLGKQPYLSQTL